MEHPPETQRLLTDYAVANLECATMQARQGFLDTALRLAQCAVEQIQKAREAKR